MAEWQNRIVGHGEEAPDQLLANPANWRIHPKHQQDALAGVLREVGVVQNVIVNRRTGFLVDGHLRVSLAMRENQPTIPVVYVDLDEAEEALVLSTLDPLAALAATDRDKLDELLREVKTGEAAVQAMLSSLGGVEPDIDELWKGMPEFEQEDQTAFQSIHVHFQTAADRDTFAELVGQSLTDKTRSIWYPKAEIARYADKRYTDES